MPSAGCFLFVCSCGVGEDRIGDAAQEQDQRGDQPVPEDGARKRGAQPKMGRGGEKYTYCMLLHTISDSSSQDIRIAESNQHCC